ncbi:hypothetical protein DSL72_001467 [Monilinia vaccinii-corymbosi]|uniref:Uncharacterized protein n=1 Tax=Monilinia vaccinii-corymbosi TaxID=61207 RepID=A0A8A3P9B6_9HELO|nr:hypothetical protein DSL72_001467 [Monilinia vaccinii-corymbosi]
MIGSEDLAGFVNTTPGLVHSGVMMRARFSDDLALGTSEEHVVPTWSWASVDAPVLFHEANPRHWRKPQLDPSPRDPKLHRAEISPHAVMLRTASVEPYSFNTRQGVHTGKALGLIVFDTALQAKDKSFYAVRFSKQRMWAYGRRMAPRALAWYVLRVEEATPEHLKCTRVD